MLEDSSPLVGTGGPRRRRQQRPFALRAQSWLVWWILLFGLWVLLDYSLATAELAVGAGVAAVSALVTELVMGQAAVDFRIRLAWLRKAFALPGRVARDTVIVFGALWRLLAYGQQPPSGFTALPTAWGEESARGLTRRVLLVGGTSVAPNTLVLGIDREREVMIVHHLVRPPGQRQENAGR